MFDPPITTIGTITEKMGDTTYRVTLPNGKLTIGHVPKAHNELHSSLLPNVAVSLELTPYDLEKARIVALAENSN